MSQQTLTSEHQLMMDFAVDYYWGKISNLVEKNDNGELPVLTPWGELLWNQTKKYMVSINSNNQNQYYDLYKETLEQVIAKRIDMTTKNANIPCKISSSDHVRLALGIAMQDYSDAGIVVPGQHNLIFDLQNNKVFLEPYSFMDRSRSYQLYPVVASTG